MESPSSISTVDEKNVRACDACRRRKVKCNKAKPECSQCAQLDLNCIYSPPNGTLISRIGNKRGKVIKEYRRRGEGYNNTVVHSEDSMRRFDKTFFRGVLVEYRQSIFPVMPIISRDELSEAIENMDFDSHNAALVYSAIAVTIRHTNLTFPELGYYNNDELVRLLVDKSLDARGPIKPSEKRITVPVIMMDVFISSCLVSLAEIEIAWFYLREAITLGKILRLDVEPETDAFSPEQARRSRLYWLMFIHERFVAINFNRHCQLDPLSKYPEFDNGALTEMEYEGYIQLIKLFSLIDKSLVEAYLDASTVVDKYWLEQKQNDILTLEKKLCEVETICSMIRADLLITQQWLKIVLWKMAMSRYRLSLSLDAQNFMSLLFPIEIASKLEEIISTTCKRDIEVHGCAMIQKMFELTISISDVIILIPSQQLKESPARFESYLKITEFLNDQSSIITTPQKDLLSEKVQKLKDTYHK